MSYTELQSGKIYKVGIFTPDEMDNYMKNVVEEVLPEKYQEIIENNGFPCWINGWIEVYNDEMYPNMYIYQDEKLFKVCDVKNHEDGGYFCDITKSDDDEYNFITQYYNGGTCLSEILEEECKKL